jgi:tetratricopeptide (TPR) repeat protein
MSAVAVLAAVVFVVSVPSAVAATAVDPIQWKQSREIEELSSNLEKSEREIERILLPVSVLIGILALGGGLGVVFSIRDQRRVSQLHELTVAGEASSQRRSEQSYASFLEQSQTTLSLVNDTLELAKEATDRAAKSMEEKAQLRVDAIEERAQRLMLDVFNSREFELVVEDPVRRAELHSIGEELRALEGFLSLQDIKLKHYAKFVKALDQFLLDDTDSAVQALQLASQDRTAGDLPKFVEYWLGYMLTTVGEYEEAIAKFEHDEIDIDKDTSQWFQLERIIGETRFFQLAKPTPGTDSWGDDGRDPRDPHQRFEAVAGLLDQLADRASRLDASEHHRAKVHTQLELARTRADVYEWVAYDQKHLDDPLDANAVKAGEEILRGHRPLAKPSDLLTSSLWQGLSEPDLLRYWALKQTQEICEVDLEETSAEVDFALAECYFKLRDDRAVAAFDKAEETLPHQFGEHREKRREVALHQSLLICHCRHFTLHDQEMKRQGQEKAKKGTAEGAAVEMLKRHIQQAQRATQEKLSEMRQGRVTVFSHIQRRNLTQDEFRTEVKDIVDQEEAEPEGGGQVQG